MSNGTTIVKKDPHNAAKVCGQIANNVDTLKKFGSVLLSVAEIALIILGLRSTPLGAATGLSHFKGQLKDSKDVIGATGIFGRIADWGDPAARKKILASKTKTANKVALTCGQALETVGFIDKLTFRFFFQAAFCIGVIPVFDLVKNTFFAVSSAFGLYDANKDRKKSNEQKAKFHTKEKKWIQREKDLGKLENVNRFALIEKFQNKLKVSRAANGNNEVLSEKETKWTGYINALTTKGDVLAVEYHAHQVKAFQALRTESLVKKYEKKLVTVSDAVKKTKIENYITALKDNKVSSILNYKVENYKIRVDNQRNEHKKAWIGIAAEVGKLFMIIVGTAILGLSVIFPVLALPAVVIVMASLGLISNSIGLGKNLYSDVFYKSKLQKELQFKIA